MSRKSNKVLIFAAHPDDEILGCGGVIQKHVKAGGEVFVCIVTDGSSSQYPEDKEIARLKDKQCEKANKYLGVTKVIHLNFPDMKLDTISHMELNNKLNEITEEIKPNIIYVHSSVDLSKDHVCINKSLSVVTRPGKDYLERVYEYEVLSSTEWDRYETFLPNTFEILERDFLKRKQEAFGFYTTEIRDYPHSRSLEGIKILANYRGLQVGARYAEAFKLIVDYRK